MKNVYLPGLIRLFCIVIFFLSLDSVNAQWTTTGPPSGYEVTSVVAIGTNVFAGLDGDGVYLSTNNGGSWTAVNSGLTDLNVIALGVSGANLFAGTNGGAFLSTNNGASWTAINNGLQSTSTVVYSFASTGQYVFAGIEGNGVYVTTDNGSTWTAANTGLGTIFPTSLVAAGSTIYAASQYGGVFISYNYGGSWTSAADAGLNTDEIYALAVQGSTIFAGTSQYGVLVSTDSGANWTAANNGIGAGYYNIYSLAALDTGQGVCKASVFAGTELGGLFETANNGASWTPVDTGLPSGTYISSLLIAGNTLFAGTNGHGVYQRTIPSAGGSLAPPQITVSKIEFCPNDSSQLCVPAGFSSYNWNTGATGNCLEAKQAGSYYVSVTDNSGCTAVSNQITLSLYPVPVDSVVAGKDILCAGDSTGICALAGFVLYQWNAPGAGTGNCITARQTGTYYVTVTDNNGCTAVSNQVSISASPALVDSVTTDKDIFCSNDSTTVCALAGFTAYQWNVQGAGNKDCITVKAAGNYYVTVTDNNGCTAESNHLLVSVYPVPSVSIIQKGDTLSSYGEVSYQWYLNDEPISNATNAMYIATQQGSYAVQVTDSNGCTAISNPVSVTITGINEVTSGTLILYPNPTSNSFIVETTNTGSQQLQLFDLTGQLLLSQPIQNSKTSIDASGLAAGVYLVSLKGAEGSATEKLIIAR